MWYRIHKDGVVASYKKALKDKRRDEPNERGGIRYDEFFIGNFEIWCYVNGQFTFSVYTEKFNKLVWLGQRVEGGVWYLLLDEDGKVPADLVAEEPAPDAFRFGRWAVKGWKVWYQVKKDAKQELNQVYSKISRTIEPLFYSDEQSNHKFGDTTGPVLIRTLPKNVESKNDFFVYIYRNNIGIMGKGTRRHPFLAWFKTISYKFGFNTALLYSYLLRRCWKKGGKIKRYFINIDYKTIEQDTGLNRKQISYAKNRLVRAGFLEEKKHGRNGISLKIAKLPYERPKWIIFYPLFVRLLGVRAGLCLLNMINEYEIRGVRPSNWEIMKRLGVKRTYISKLKKKLREEYNLDVGRNSLVFENVLSCLLRKKPLVSADDPRDEALRTWFVFTPNIIGSDILYELNETIKELKNLGEKAYFMKYYEDTERRLNELRRQAEYKEEEVVSPTISIQGGVFDGVVVNDHLKRYGLENVTSVAYLGQSIYENKRVLYPDRLYKKLLYRMTRKYSFNEPKLIRFVVKVKCPSCKYEKRWIYVSPEDLVKYVKEQDGKMKEIKCPMCENKFKIIAPKFLITGITQSVT